VAFKNIASAGEDIVRTLTLGYLHPVWRLFKTWPMFQ